MKVLQRLLLLAYFVVATLPLAWMAVTSLKTRDDAISLDPRVVPLPSADGGPHAPLTFAATTDAFRRLSHVHVGAEEDFWSYLWNSAFIGLGSTLASVVLGTLAAYGFSRYPIAGAKDWLFFILSTRFLPPLAVVVPILFMYRELDLQGTHLGLILLYTAFNLSLSVWLMKGFIDEIPRAFEEAALVDGYTRMESFFKIVLPQAATGIAATAVFCFITAWNEYAFALMMTNRRAQTAPPYIPAQLGSGITDWTVIAAGTFLFLLPVAIFTFLLRKHLLRGVTFGAIRK